MAEVIVIFDTPSSGTTWTVPDGVTELLMVEAWGAGGGGLDGVSKGNNQGCGGGGGAYSNATNIEVIPGGELDFVVGAGGLHGVPPTAGEDSWFKTTDTVFAQGGQISSDSGIQAAGGDSESGFGSVRNGGGRSGIGGSGSGSGGGGGAGASGGSGGNGSNNGGPGGVGATGSPVSGGSGGAGVPALTNTPGNPGTAPGGGASGGGLGANGGKGGDGMIRIVYDDGTAGDTGSGFFGVM